MKNNILLLGGSGNLGSKITKSKIFSNLKHPSKKKLNILSKNKIEKYLIKNDIDLILHCAAFARLKECELNKKIAEKVNVIGTQNIVKSILKVKKIKKKDVKLVFISSDAIASLSFYLCSNEASEITGSSINIDGGWTAW